MFSLVLKYKITFDVLIKEIFSKIEFKKVKINPIFLFWLELETCYLQGKGRRLVGTFSATDLRGCPISQLRSWLPISVMEFTEKLSLNPPHVAAAPSDLATASRELVTCDAESLLSEVVDKAVTKHVHRVWVVDQMGLLVGLVSLTDIIRVIRASLLQELS